MLNILEVHFYDHPYKALNDLKIDFTNPLWKNQEETMSRAESMSDEAVLELRNGRYNSIIIGKNGSGKSQVLRSVVLIMNTICASNQHGRFIAGMDFSGALKYKLDGIIYEFEYRLGDKTPKCFKDREPCELLDLKFPKKILVTCFNLNDKYPVYTAKSKLRNNAYEYLGLRAASNNAFINVNLKKIIESLSAIISKKERLADLSIVFDSLELSTEIELRFKNGKLFVNDKTGKSIAETYESEEAFVKYYNDAVSSSKDYRRDSLSKLIGSKDTVKDVISFIQKKKEVFNVKKKKDLKYETTLSVGDNKNASDSNSDIAILLKLKDLEILDFDQILIKKAKSKYPFSEASSGEYNMLSSILSILAKIEPNSLVIIDEPEVSFHPNWQIEYMTILRNVFCNIKGCHFIIASHSHFIISDIFQTSSHIVILNTSADGLHITKKYFDDNTYGWSTEEILYYVFGVRSSRNEIFQIEVEKLLGLISNRSQDYETIYNAILKLAPYKLNEYDPLNKVIEIGRDYLRSNHYVANK